MNAATSIEVRILPTNLIDESPSNKRRNWGKLDELASSFQEHGILEPALARPKGKRFELVFGHRRYRGAKIAEMDLPTMVRDLDDKTVLEMQLVENGEREDIHPLDEADGYQELHVKHACTVDQIANTVKKTRAHVVSRMKLVTLCTEAREAFLKEKISTSIATMIARIPTADLQKKALKDITESAHWNRDDDPMGPRQASAIIQQRFMLRLADAPFKTTDPELVPKAGACTTCPKRTGNQRELFSDVKSADVCTDPTCFSSKRDAEWKKRVEQAKASNQTVMLAADAKKLFPYSNRFSSGDYVELDQPASYSSKRTWRDVLKKDMPPVVLVRDPEGGIHEVVRAKAAQARLPKPKAPTPAARKESAADTKAREKFKVAEEKKKTARVKVLGKIAAAAQSKEIPADFLRALILDLVDMLGFYGGVDDVATRREWTIDAKKQESSIKILIASMKASELRGLLVEMNVASNSKLLDEAKKAFKVRA